MSKTNPCKNCGSEDFGLWTSTKTGKTRRYCRPCRQLRAAAYAQRKKVNGGSHTKREWLDLLAQYDHCPGKVCEGKRWEEIPPRANKRFKNVWTKDHIMPLKEGGSDNIENIQPLCYICNFTKGSKVIKQ